MNDQSVDALTRRVSLKTLGAAGLAGLAGSLSASAKNKKKGNKNKNKKCKRQVGQCRAGLAELCEVVFGADEVEACLDLFAPCCEPLNGCHTDQAFACAVAVVEGLET